MTSTNSIPMPPLHMRSWVGPTDPEDFDNPSGAPIYADYDIPLRLYETVLDFGCGCGRLARRLLQQTPRPRRYVGIDVHRGMIEWCREHLSPVDPNFQFLHHDVYAPSYAPGNGLRLALPLPVKDATCSLVIAHSVFTHLTKGQAEYYLSETARILTPEGIALTTWFFFDRASFPFLPEVYCLYTSEVDFSQAVLFDREWFIATVRNLGLGVLNTRPPVVAGINGLSSSANAHQTWWTSFRWGRKERNGSPVRQRGQSPRPLYHRKSSRESWGTLCSDSGRISPNHLPCSGL